MEPTAERESFEPSRAETIPVDGSAAAETAPGEDEALAKLEADLEAIDVDSVLPEELRGPAPRELPPDVKHGYIEVQRKRAAQACFWTGAFCLAFWPVPFVKILALYLLPLGYLPWIALGFWAINLYLLLFRNDFKKAARYVTDGEAGVGIVTDMTTAVTQIYNGTPTQSAHFAAVFMKDPSTSKPTFRTFRSREIPVDQTTNIRPRFNVGDPVAVVWQPADFDKTAELYDFIELTPRSGLIREKPKVSPIAVVFGIFATLGFFAWGFYVLLRYFPEDFGAFQRTAHWPAVVGAIVGFIAFAVWTVWKKLQSDAHALAATSDNAAPASENAPAPTTFLGGVSRLLLFVFGAELVAFAAAFYLNATLDASKPTKKMVEITEMTQTTYNFVVRVYSMEYRYVGEKRKRDLTTTPQHLDQFDVRAGFARIRAGAFGWPWLETIEPLPVQNGAPQR